MQNIATQELIKNKSMLGMVTVFAQASRTILWRQRKENRILRFAEAIYRCVLFVARFT